MGALITYLQGLSNIRQVGEAVVETSYYGQLEAFLNEVGETLTPRVLCVLTTRNRGAGVPDGGLFIKGQAAVEAGPSVMVARSPERGAMEVKGAGEDVRSVARSRQVQRYLERYGQVLVTTYREFLQVRINSEGEAVEGEAFSLAENEEAFWALAAGANSVTPDLEEEIERYVQRILLADAPLSSPADLAWFLAHYARTGLDRLEASHDIDALTVLRGALEEALGLRFEGEEGEHFFRSALVQTLFYGVFAAWVVWSERHPPDSSARFSWREAQWTLDVPMVRVLFTQLATPADLPVGLDEVLDWTEEALNRVDRKLFFERFEPQAAVQYFYEPFLQEYDPELRRELGVWYTPPQVVRYIVAKVHHALKEHLGLPLGLADDQVHILDPGAGTGSFLVEAVRTIAKELETQHGDALVAQQTKQAALSRIYGFELLPAPFVVAHLQVGLALDRLGAALDAQAGERAQVYLTNSLTGWVQGEEHPRLPFPEFEQERDAAESVKRTTPILVVLGNPPYNGFAGVSGEEEGDLVEPYKEGLTDDWDITKNKLDDLYIRFFRVAERRITEQTGRGIVCFISNFGWLGDPSTVVMRKRVVREFDAVYIDNLNGDSRETGKKTPEGDPDPSVFSTRLNPPGIQVGTAISLLVRTQEHDDERLVARYRDFWGATKRDALERSLVAPEDAPDYEELGPTEDNWYRLRRWSPRQGYENWPSVADLAAEEPLLGLNENRGGALIDHDCAALLDRMRQYLDPEISLRSIDPRLSRRWARFDPAAVRERLLERSPFDEGHAVRFQVKPFDLRWAYVDTTAKLWNEVRASLVRASGLGSEFLLVRRRAPRALDGAAFLHSRRLIDQHVMHKDAYTVPFLVAADDEEDGPERLFAVEQRSEQDITWRPNLSQRALDYLGLLGIDDAGTSPESARLLWLHALAIGYSPLYLDENGDAIRNDWPRVPLPTDRGTLERSAELGASIATLLDLEHPVLEIESAIADHLHQLAVVEATGGATVTDEQQLAVTAGWGFEQVRRLQGGGETRLVMPGSGRFEARFWTEDERAPLSEQQIELLGQATLDVYLNDEVRWTAVPRQSGTARSAGFRCCASGCRTASSASSDAI